MVKHPFYWLLFLIIISPFHLSAQDSLSSLPDNYKRNAIKWNLTPFIIWSNKNINLSYERVLSPHRSFSLNAGYFELPSTGIYDSLNIKNERQKGGLTFSGDYRFYFKGRNKRMAPDGLYWGIYGSYHHYQFQNVVTFLESDVLKGDFLLDGRLNIVSAGVELGYQFVIKERLTIDLVFLGPSLSAYNSKLGLETNLDFDEESEYLQAIYDLLIAEYPWANELVETGERNDKGFKTSLGFGLRYLIQIGYRF